MARLQHAPERPRVEYTGRYDKTRADYDRVPVKPVLDGEPVYEDHPVAFDAQQPGPLDREPTCGAPLYWDLFSGAFGHTYGHHSVWQFSLAGAHAGQRAAAAVDRGDQSAGRRADAARPRAARVASVPHADAR